VLDPNSVLFKIVVGLPAFLLAIVLHEVAHGYVAYRCGDDTAKLAGRLTLSPLPHFDLLGALMFVVSSWAGFGFGWAKPVPVNPLRFRNFRRDYILVSLAGVATNLGQAVIWSVLLRATLHFAAESSFALAFALFCVRAIQINIVLFVFNLLPIPPLDGWHVLTQVLRIGYSTTVLRLEHSGFFLLFILMYLRVLDPILTWVILPLYRVFLPASLF